MLFVGVSNDTDVVLTCLVPGNFGNSDSSQITKASDRLLFREGCAERTVDGFVNLS